MFTFASSDSKCVILGCPFCGDKMVCKNENRENLWLQMVNNIYYCCYYILECIKWCIQGSHIEMTFLWYESCIKMWPMNEWLHDVWSNRKKWESFNLLLVTIHHTHTHTNRHSLTTHFHSFSLSIMANRYRFRLGTLFNGTQQGI